MRRVSSFSENYGALHRTRVLRHEQGFRSPVLLDRIFGAGSVLGAGGTRSAVIIDEQGVVAPEVGVGAPAVLALAGSDVQLIPPLA